MIIIKKLLKRTILFILIACSFFFISCKKETEQKQKTIIPDYYLTYYIDGVDVSTNVISANETITLKEAPTKDEYIFHGWFTDSEYTQLFTDNKISKDTSLYGYYEQIKYPVTLISNCDTEIPILEFAKGEIIANIPELNKDSFYLEGWYLDERLHDKYDIENETISGPITLYAKWKLVNPEYINLNFISISDNLFANKDDLYTSYYTYFYMFLVEHTDCDLENVSLKDFLTQGKTWEIDGKSDMYHFGFNYGKYYITSQEGGTLEEQDPEHFLGYCYQNGKYIDLIKHLETFFAYWRTDEGYTGSSDDPNNTGNDFYIEPWASMVDTAKFFFFTSDTLQDKYDWFDSERVKDALDHIPSVIEVNNTEIVIDEEYLFNNDFDDYSVSYYLDKDGLVEINYLSLDYLLNYNQENLTIYLKIEKNN